MSRDDEIVGLILEHLEKLPNLTVYPLQAPDTNKGVYAVYNPGTVNPPGKGEGVVSLAGVSGSVHRRVFSVTVVAPSFSAMIKARTAINEHLVNAKLAEWCSVVKPDFGSGFETDDMLHPVKYTHVGMYTVQYDWGE